MSLNIKWINFNKPRKTLSNTTFKEDIVHPAHSEETYGFKPYVSKKYFDFLVQGLKDIDKTKDPSKAAALLKVIEEI